jgi:hypothetical protein
MHEYAETKKERRRRAPLWNAVMLVENWIAVEDYCADYSIAI